MPSAIYFSDYHKDNLHRNNLDIIHLLTALHPIFYKQACICHAF